MVRFGSLERDYSLSKGDMTLEKVLRSRHEKDVQLHNLLGSQRPVNELRAISASMYNVITISCKKTWKILCKQVLHNCAVSWGVDKTGTRNIPEHRIIIIIMRKICKIKCSKLKLNKNKLVSARNTKNKTET